MLLSAVPEKGTVDGINAWLEVEGNTFDKLNEVDTFFHHVMKVHPLLFPLCTPCLCLK